MTSFAHVVSTTHGVAGTSLELCYEAFGDEHSPPLLLIMGLGAQMLGWDEAFCKQLAKQGFYVVRFDNRDIGLSTKFDAAPAGNPLAVISGDASSVAYSLSDMANDAVALLSALDIPRAHIVGASMGAMIAQLVAINHPDRVLSLVSIMGTTGARDVGEPSPEAVAALMSQQVPNEGESTAVIVASTKVFGSPDYPLTENQVRAKAEKSVARSYYPEGASRQFVAILATPDRTEALAAVAVPTAVLHGEADPLIGVSGGRATAKAIPNAELMTFPGMAHDLPYALWPDFIDAIVRTAARASAND